MEELLQKLAGLKAGEYDRDDYALVQALRAANSATLFWKALEIAHQNGMAQAAAAVGARAQGEVDDAARQVQRLVEDEARRRREKP